VPVLLVHGSRRDGWAEPFERLRTLLQQRLELGELLLAYMQFAEPTLSQVLDRLRRRGASNVRVFPLFLAAGAHLQHDVPRMIEEYCSKYPEMRVE
jgi:sirohydrochlorin cobaltochelatase